METARHKQIMSHAEAQFRSQQAALAEKYNQELRKAQYRATQTHNTAAMLPAEADCYIAHIKTLVVAKARCIADAYTAFNEPTGQEAEVELTSFFSMTLAARKSTFQANAEMRQRRTGYANGQVAPLLHGFERNVNPALLEARAILDRQRIEITNRPQPAPVTKYVVDTCIFNWLADTLISKGALPSDGGFAITHVQVDEINKTKDEERRARLLIIQASLHCLLLPTQSFVFDVSRFGHAKLSDGKLFTSLRTELDTLNGKKLNNVRDALIAEAAIANGYTLLTADRDLKQVTEKHAGKVIFYSAPTELQS